MKKKNQEEYKGVAFDFLSQIVMKRLVSSDSLGALVASCPTRTADKQSPKKSNQVYSREFQSMLDGLDEEGCVEEPGHVSEKKRRLSVDQVKALEKHFEVENKLEPERKVKVAQELGLQPRQVAIWFQNRRARWKTKQLEKDYGFLKANYDSLKLSYDNLQHENEALRQEIMELKRKLLEENTESNDPVKEEKILPIDPELKQSNLLPETESKDLKYECFNCGSGGDGRGNTSLFPADFKDGSSDSDSSMILNEDRSPNAANSSSGMLQSCHLFMPPASSSPPAVNFFQFQRSYQQQYVKLEEHNFLSADEEACNFFSEEQDPSLQWVLF